VREWVGVDKNPGNDMEVYLRSYTELVSSYENYGWVFDIVSFDITFYFSFYFYVYIVLKYFSTHSSGEQLGRNRVSL